MKYSVSDIQWDVSNSVPENVQKELPETVTLRVFEDDLKGTDVKEHVKNRLCDVFHCNIRSFCIKTEQ